MVSLVMFFLGTVLGSFSNVCIYRLPRGESIVYPPSHCPRCKTPIKPWHNIPILSFLFSRQGKSQEIEHLMIVVTATITDLQEQALRMRGY